MARSLDRDAKHLQEMIKRAAAHKGAAFIEIFQNCSIFNDGAFDVLTDKKTKDDNVLVLEHGKPMLFGANKNKGIIMDGAKPKVVEVGNGSHRVEDILVHDEFDESPVLATLLAHLTDDATMPTPIGIFRQISKATYDGEVEAQIHTVTDKKGKGDLEKVLFAGNTWEVN